MCEGGTTSPVLQVKKKKKIVTGSQGWLSGRNEFQSQVSLIPMSLSLYLLHLMKTENYSP